MIPLPHQPHPFAVRFDDVSCHIAQRTILDHLSLDIASGAITGILGPNGAGKTTLLAMVMGLRRPSAGTVQVLGTLLPVRDGALRRRIGVVLQETALYDELTTFENLRFAASLYQVPHAKQRIAEVLDLLGLADRAEDVVRTLSGGLQRRVAIARALLHQPDLLVIDEPTLGVDVDTRHAIWAHLRLLRSVGTTVLAATNYLDEALALCDSVAVLRQGTLIAHESPQTLVARAGSCLEVECQPEAVESITHALADFEGVLRIEPTPIGVAIFLEGVVISDRIMPIVAQAAPITGMRLRAADLAEVFHALTEVSA